MHSLTIATKMSSNSTLFFYRVINDIPRPHIPDNLFPTYLSMLETLKM